jgi:hypothetical protein
MDERRRHDGSADEGEREEAKHGRGAMDPGLREQFERDTTVVRDHPSVTPDADALQRPHYEPERLEDEAKPPAPEK